MEKTFDAIESVLRALFNRTVFKVYLALVALGVVADFCFKNQAGRTTVGQAMGWLASVEIGHLVAFILLAPLAAAVLCWWGWSTYRDVFPRRG